MSALKKISLVLLALVVISGLVAATVQPAAAADNAKTCKQWYTVQRGDYLVKIARMYDTDWRTLADLNDLKTPERIYPGQKLCVSTDGSGTSAPVPSTSSSSGVRVYASSVEEDKTVTLEGKKLDVNSRYTLYLSKYGTYPTGAILVGSILTDRYGAFMKTFNLPSKLVDISKIGIHITNGRDATSNWFINATADGNTGGDGAPTFSVSLVSVREDDWVKIKTSNLPANVTFDVLMGKSGSKGVKGIKVGTLRDDEGGSLKATFDIPSELVGKSKIDIRLENKSLGIVTYLTFEN